MQTASKSQTGLFSRCFTHWHSECLFSISAICTYWGFATKKQIFCWPPKPCQHATCHACFCAYILGLFTILIIQHGHGTTNGALPEIRQTTSAFPAKLLQRVVLYLGNHHLGIGKASTRCVSNRVCWKVYRKTWGKLTFAEHGLKKQIQKGSNWPSNTNQGTATVVHVYQGIKNHIKYPQIKLKWRPMCIPTKYPPWN